MTTILGSQE